jgi:hypothetical protein
MQRGVCEYELHRLDEQAQQRSALKAARKRSSERGPIYRSDPSVRRGSEAEFAVTLSQDDDGFLT